MLSEHISTQGDARQDKWYVPEVHRNCVILHFRAKIIQLLDVMPGMALAEKVQTALVDLQEFHSPASARNAPGI